MASILTGLKVAWDFMKDNGRPMVHGLSDGIMNILGWHDGVVDLNKYVPGIAIRDDEVVTAEDARTEQVLKDALGMSVKEIVASYIFNENLDLRIWNRALMGTRMRIVFLTQILEFEFAPESGYDEVNKMPIVGKNDHASFHLNIKNFANYKNLLNHEFFKFGVCTVKSQQISPDYTGTTVCFYPLSKDTSNLTNDQLCTACNQTEGIANMPINYVIRTVAPAVFEKKTINGKEKIISSDPRVLPNTAFRSGYISDLGEDEFLSYGTLVFLKANTSEVPVALRFIVTMEFMVWDQDTITDYEYETGGTGATPGSENPTSSHAIQLEGRRKKNSK